MMKSSKKRAQSLIEYGLILALVAIVAITVLTRISNSINSVGNSAATAVEDSTDSALAAFECAKQGKNYDAATAACIDP